MNAKILVLIIYAEAIIYLLLCNFHDCNFNKFRKEETEENEIAYNNQIDFCVSLVRKAKKNI